MSGKKRAHVIVEGRVQGVFFRAYTSDEAKKLGLAGWVRNRPEGSVEAIIEGDAASVRYNAALVLPGFTGIQGHRSTCFRRTARLEIIQPLKFTITNIR